LAGNEQFNEGIAGLFLVGVSNPEMQKPARPHGLFCIIEVDDGLTVIELKSHETPEDAALRERGTLVDLGPYVTRDDALDVLAELEAEDGEI